MRFYTQQHNFYCGVDLHARSVACQLSASYGSFLAGSLAVLLPESQYGTIL